MSIALRASRRTLAEELRLQLADEIVRGALPPGAALDEMELARRFSCVAHAGARGAIRQLTASGLIEARALIARRWWRVRARKQLIKGCSRRWRNWRALRARASPPSA